MNRIKILLLASAVLALSLVSCRKEPLDMVNPNNRICKSYLQQFETVWQGMDQGYVFWEKDTVDWDARTDPFSRLSMLVRPTNQ